MLVSKFLSEFTDSHGIFNHASLAERFTKGTGLPATWASHSRAAIVKSIEARGLGGELAKGPEDERFCVGYIVAEHLAHNLIGYTSPAQGRGRRWADCVQALERAGK